MQIQERGLIAVLVACVIFGVGCNRQPTMPQEGAARNTNTQSAPEVYANAYKALMVEYQERMKALTSRPIPPKSAPKTERHIAIAQQVEEIAAANAAFLKRLRNITPPQEFEGVHTATIASLEVEEKGNRRWAEAIRSGNKEERNRTLQETEMEQSKASSLLQQELKKVGSSSPGLSALVGELQKSSEP